jgi:hypothetical protein
MSFGHHTGSKFPSQLVFPERISVAVLKRYSYIILREKKKKKIPGI